MSDMEKKVELPSAELVLRVPFHDVDAMGVVWHGNYFRYLEQARCELLRQIGYDYPAMEASGYLWPVIDTRLKFIASLRFDQLIRVAVRVTEFENRLRLDYTLFDAVTGQRASKGYTIQVAVEKHSGEMLLASPAILLEKLGVQP